MNRRGAMLLASAAALRPTLARAAAAEPFAMTEVAPGIFVRHGVHEEASRDNEDGIANIGFIVGAEAVAVIDPGGSREDGTRLRASVHSRTRLPIRFVVMTHFHPDHVFGAGVFAEDRPVFVGHARMVAKLVQRGEFYRNSLIDLLGLDEAGDYASPGLLVENTARLDLGRRQLLLQAHPTAHTDNDLSIFDEETGTLWAGDLLFVDRVPSLDGSIVGWLAATQALRASPAKHAVPGHGPVLVDWPAAAAAQERYLGGLVRDIRAIIARGGDIEDAIAMVGLGERDGWLLFDDYNGRNVTAAYKELEWE